MRLDIVSPKVLEKQIRALDAQIAKLAAETAALEKVRDACRTLLEVAAEMPAERPAPRAPRAKRAPRSPKPAAEKPPAAAVSPAPLGELPARIATLLKERKQGLSADQIFDELRAIGVPIPGKRPVTRVYSLLEKHPELFHQNDDGKWLEAH